MKTYQEFMAEAKEATYKDVQNEIVKFFQAGRVLSRDMQIENDRVAARYYGTWVSDNSDDEDDDWQRPDKATFKKVKDFEKKLQTKYKKFTIRAMVGEKNWIDFMIEPK